MLFPFQIRSQKLPFHKHIVEKHYIRTYPTDSSCTFPSPAPRNHPSKWRDCRTNREAWEFHLCLTCIALFSWFLCRSLAEHVESCHGWIHYPIHHSVSVGHLRGAIVNKETIQTSQLVPYTDCDESGKIIIANIIKCHDFISLLISKAKYCISYTTFQVLNIQTYDFDYPPQIAMWFDSHYYWDTV